MANAASATCAWSETSEEGLDRPTAPRGWSAGIFEWVFERLERQERIGSDREGCAKKGRDGFSRWTRIDAVDFGARTSAGPTIGISRPP